MLFDRTDQNGGWIEEIWDAINKSGAPFEQRFVALGKILFRNRRRVLRKLVELFAIRAILFVRFLKLFAKDVELFAKYTMFITKKSVPLAKVAQRYRTI